MHPCDSARGRDPRPYGKLGYLSGRTRWSPLRSGQNCYLARIRPLVARRHGRGLTNPAWGCNRIRTLASKSGKVRRGSHCGRAHELPRFRESRGPPRALPGFGAPSIRKRAEPPHARSIDRRFCRAATRSCYEPALRIDRRPSKQSLEPSRPEVQKTSQD